MLRQRNSDKDFNKRLFTNLNENIVRDLTILHCFLFYFSIFHNLFKKIFPLNTFLPI